MAESQQTVQPVTAPSAFQSRAEETRNHLGHLDALRGIAVLGVLAIHVGQASPSGIDMLTYTGQRGVQLFFVVSAFTLMLSGDNRKAEPHARLAFFLRRFFRLAPLYYPCILLSRSLYAPLHFAALPTFLSFLFLHNLVPAWCWAGTFGGWSLGNEALFYMCLPLLYRWVRTLRRATVLLAISIPVSIATVHLGLHFFPVYYDYWTFYGFLSEFPVFLMGIMAYFLWKEHLRPLVGTETGKSLSMLFLLLTLGVYELSMPIQGLQLLETSIGCVTLLCALSLYPWSFLVNRFTIFMGKISYSVYLTHFFLLFLVLPWLAARHRWAAPAVHHQTLHAVVLYLVLLAVASAISTLTWLFIEEPGIRLGRRVIRRIQGKSGGPSQRGPLAPITEPLLSTRDTPAAQF